MQNVLQIQHVVAQLISSLTAAQIQKGNFQFPILHFVLLMQLIFLFLILECIHQDTQQEQRLNG